VQHRKRIPGIPGTEHGSRLYLTSRKTWSVPGFHGFPSRKTWSVPGFLQGQSTVRGFISQAGKRGLSRVSVPGFFRRVSSGFLVPGFCAGGEAAGPHSGPYRSRPCVGSAVRTQLQIATLLRVRCADPTPPGRNCDQCLRAFAACLRCLGSRLLRTRLCRHPQRPIPVLVQPRVDGVERHLLGREQVLSAEPVDQTGAVQDLDDLAFGPA
jgi:hypothetical protein